MGLRRKTGLVRPEFQREARGGDGAWSHWQEVVKNEHSASFLLPTQSEIPAHDVLSTLRMSSYINEPDPENCSHTHAQGFVSKVIPGPVKLRTNKNRHRG